MTFATSCAHYAQAGWPCVIPVPPEAKFPPPEGYTGAAGADTGPEVLEYWASTLPDHSIALRMPDGIVGIDVDDYAKGETVKCGGAQLAEKEAAWGQLPATWSSTARGGGNGDGPGASRIMFFRVPAGRYVTKLGADIDVIQRHHRYAVVAPSIHHAVGSPYQWYDPAGHLSARMPAPSELAELPETWVQHLAEGAAQTGPAAADAGSGQMLLGQLLSDDRPACADCTNAEAEALRLLTGALPGSRHDTMTERVYHIVQLGAEGHPGTGSILDRLRSQWDALTAGENRGSEFEAMLTTAARKAVTHIGATQMRTYDPCLVTFGVTWAAPAPDGPPDEPPPKGISPSRIVSVRTYIGAEPFDPLGLLDHTLARSVLERMHPAMRYAADADTWLLRGPWAWTAPPGDLAQWAITELTELMPLGDAGADADTPDGQREIQRAARRARFGTSATSSGISRKMKAHVLAGTHPSSMGLGSLDSEPEILWAGGTAWDIRASLHGPVQAAIDPGTPHLHSAGVMPERRPTPLWDAYVQAVWPDPELRQWALRVLSIAFTGYADKAMPILRGDTDRGKTQLIVLLMSVLGTYAHTANSKLLSGADRSHDSIIFALKGRRLSFIDEAPRGGHLAQERLKQLTGGSALTGNAMQKNPVTFDPTHTLILTANEEAEPQLTDAAVRRRTRLIPCTGNPDEVIAARAAIGNLSGPAWQSEAPGVLALMMSLAASWLADPSSAYSSAAPMYAQAVTEQIAAGQDHIRSWVEEETEASEAGTGTRELYKIFVQSCRNISIPQSAIPSEKRFGLRLAQLGFPPVRRETGNFRLLRARLNGTNWGSAYVPPSPEVVRHAEKQGNPGGSTPKLEGPGGSSEQPSRDNPPRSAPVTDPLPGGMEDNSALFTRKKEKDIPPIDTGNSKTAPTLQEPPKKDDVSAGQGTPGGSDGGLGRPSSQPDASGNITERDENALAGRSGTCLPETVGASPVKSVTQSSNGAEPTQKGETESPPQPKRPENESPPQPKNPRKTRAPKPAKRIGPDPELAGPVCTLPAAVNREGVVISCTMEQARQLATQRELTIDVETTGYPIGHPEFLLRTVQLGGESVAVVFDAADPEHQAVIQELIAEAEILHAHSAPADLVPLDLAGLCTEEAWLRMDDTVLRAKLADPQLSGSDADGLKQLAADVVPGAVTPAAAEARKKLFASGKWLMDTNALTPVERSGWAQVNSGCETMVVYAASDVLDTAVLPRVLPYVPAEILDREREVQRICARVSHRGMRLDPEHVRQLRGEHRAAKAEISQRITQQYGVENPGSPKQLAPVFAELGCPLPMTAPSVKFPSGQPSTTAAALLPIKRSGGAPGELATAILDYREHATALNLILEPFGVQVDHGDGRVRPVVYTLGADTGRTSCVRPNLQQLSREGGIRACITADEGMMLISADFQAVELRTAAALSGDQALYEMILEGDRCRTQEQLVKVAGDAEAAKYWKNQAALYDLHWRIARQVWGPEATKGDRYNAKRGVFGRLYGSGIKGIAKTLGITEREAQAVADTLDAMAPGVAAWSREMQQYVRKGGRSMQAYSGRLIWLDRKFEHKAGNYCIQGTAKEFLSDGLIKWDKTRWGNSVVLPVHDEVLAVVPADEAAEATAALVEAMQTELNGMPIIAEPAEPSFFWADAS